MTKRCPLCSVELTRIPYEGFITLHCKQCHGYLVKRSRMKSIRLSRKKNIEALKKETLDELSDDTAGILRCPQCHMPMKKQLFKEPASFFIDTCKLCQWVWFDGGELSRYQLAYEISSQGREAAAFQDRHRNMSPEDRAEFEENLAKLPESKSAVEEGIFEAFVAALFSNPHMRM